MSESTNFSFDEDTSKQKHKGGIKSFTFTSTGTNGSSHRANAAKKRLQHLKNVKIRSELYSEFQGEKGWIYSSPECREWHSRLDGLSKGTA